MEHRDADARFRVSDGTVQDERNIGFTRDAADRLCGAVVVRRCPRALVLVQRRLAQVDGRTANTGLKQRLRGCGDLFQAIAGVQETPSPVAHLRAGGAAFKSAVENSGIGDAAESRSADPGRITKWGSQKIMQSRSFLG